MSAIGLNKNKIGGENGLHMLWQGIALEKHLGISLSEYSSGGKFNWANSELSETHVTEIIQVSKAKYGEDQWLKVTAQLRNVLREKQRDALVDFILSKNDQLKKSDDLYALLLLDVEMSSCTITSRIKLALSSTQLFVQRCLMNLESAVSMQGLTEERKAEWEEWTWRKNYRVWEANRKVFLYPENWLEPEWRDDKTPFFNELESELQQGELTNSNAEKAYVSYLHKLENVSNLEILAMCKGDKMEDGSMDYYFFGRTHGSPKSLFYRKYRTKPEAFSPWEKIDLNFDGDHLMPYVFENRLYLFWPKYEELSRENKRFSEPGYDDATPYWGVKLAWSEFKNGSWTPSKISDDFVDEFSPYGSSTPVFATRPFKERKKYHFFEVKKNSADSISINFCAPYDDSISGSQAVFRGRIQKFIFDPYSEVVKVQASNGFVDYRDELLDAWGSMPDTGSLNIINQRIDHSERGYLATHGGIRVFDKGLHQKIKMIPYFGSSLLQSPTIIQNESKQSSFLLLGGFRILNFYHLSLPLIIKQLGKRDFTRFFTANYDISNDSQSLFENQVSIKDTHWSGPLPTGKLELGLSQAYSQYNWELFFHIPMHIANKLRQDQKFEEAQKWFHYVFNPTSSEDVEAPKKFWLFKPFKDLVCSEDGTPCNIQDLLIALNDEGNIDGFQEFENAVHTWESNPFSPHTVARTRVIAYMKWVVMRYIDNLIEWADQLFRRDSIESLNEATQLYMLAWNILGGQPEKLNEKKRGDLSYEGLKAAGMDEFSNALVKIENKLTQAKNAKSKGQKELKFSFGGDLDRGGSNVRRTKDVGQEIITSETLYFCIPENPKLLSYWDLVCDRFYKLRNCLNIEGVYRQLPLYEPPIDPALLIKAKAAGLSLNDALSSEFDATSHYRFAALVQKAIDYANDVRVFGGALLSALEKRDAEKITELRSRHETRLIEEAGFIRSEQVKELVTSKSALNSSLKNIENRKKYYSEKEFMSGLEVGEMALSTSSQVIKAVSTFMYAGAAAASIIPTATIGYSGWGGHAVIEVGGKPIAGNIDYAAKGLNGASSILDLAASMTGQFARFERRKEEWDFQADQADGEVDQIKKQLIAADIRIAMAKKERENHKLRLENSKDQLELLQTKFTNVELYEWMIDQLKTVYFQSYQMAFDMAKKAEAALSHEFDIAENESFIQFGYWDNMKQGLLSGEKLHHDLKRMEMSYIQRNKRKQEVSQTFSLAMINPQELVRLKAEGSADLSIPEVLLDLVHPKLENRKVKSVSITIPAVTGPYTGVHATLSNGQERISTSSGQNDSGLFQLNFNDERYLPFEGANPASTWNIEMNSGFRAFDYNTISDVLIHINYTADYNSNKTSNVLAQLQALTNETPLTRFFSLKNEFANEWFQAKKEGGPMSIIISKEMLPFTFQGMTIEAINGGVKFLSLPLTEDLQESDWNTAVLVKEGDSWRITIDTSFDDDVLLLFGYQVSN